ncbi:MAG: AAA family ATPase [Pseudomonadota bacterium]|nr:AAA family ATPase [Pseudomonadota bacterium]
MDFLKLRAVNFLTLGDSGDLSLKDRGLVLIQGVNKDDTSTESNGAGKSSIADALCWVLFGATARGESGDSIINEKAKKGTFVSAILQDGESIYEIRRHRKDKQFKNATTISVWNPAEQYHIGAVGERIEKGTEKEIQRQIEEIIGCNYDVFKSAIYAGQEDMPDLPKMSTTIFGASTSSAPATTISSAEMMVKLEEVKKTIAASAPHPGPAWKKPTMFDQITAAATQFTKFEEERWTMDSKEVAAKQLASQINDTFRQAQVTGTVYSPFHLNGPAQLTIKTRQSQYKKKAFLGDEQLIFTSAYAGKRDGVIAVFKNRVPVDYAYIEIPLDEAMTQLRGFKHFVDSLRIPDLEAVLTGVESQKQHAAAVEHNRLLETAPEFASW